jgi:hypothetical protein
MAEVQEVLTSEAEVIIDRASIALDRSNEPHYTQDGPAMSRARLSEMLTLVTASIAHRDLVPMIERATQLANERFDAGFDIREVQCAFHVLEEAIWDQVVQATPPAELAHAIGLVGTVLGAGRDALARAYVSRASQQHVTSLDLGALFRGGT